jgi:hypothetical protein
MECPYCGSELRLAGSIHPARGPAMATTRCASPRCARQLVAALPGTGGDGVDVQLLKVPTAAAVDRAPLCKRELLEVMGALVIAVGATASAVVVGVRYVRWPDPGPVRTEAELVGLTLIGAVVLAVGLIIDGTLRMRRRAPVPARVELVLLALPKSYRA